MALLIPIGKLIKCVISIFWANPNMLSIVNSLKLQVTQQITFGSKFHFAAVWPMIDSIKFPSKPVL